MAKIKSLNLLEEGKNPFLTPEREKIWEKLKNSGTSISKAELFRKSQELKRNSEK
jgi:hypothetical protein